MTGCWSNYGDTPERGNYKCEECGAVFWYTGIGLGAYHKAEDCCKDVKLKKKQEEQNNKNKQNSFNSSEL